MRQNLVILKHKIVAKLAVETRAQSSYVADYYYYYAGLADKIQGEVLPIDKPDMQVFTTREPIGVVVAIVPWNAQSFPFSYEDSTCISCR